MTNVIPIKEITTLTSKESDIKNKWIAEFIRIKMPLIPLEGKVPTVKQWQNTVCNPDLTGKEFPGNYGVVITDDYMVLDVDPKRFKEGDDPFLRLKSDLGLTSGQDIDTFTVQSRLYSNGKQGLHLYFKKPRGLNLMVHSPVYGKALECLSYGHFVVGPGSIHASARKPYEVVKGSLSSIAVLPDAIIKIFSRDSYVESGGLPSFVDDVETRKLFINYLSFIPPAVWGDGGDQHTYNVAKRGRDIGLPAEATFDLMLALWNDKCQPPWESNELWVKVQNAYKYSKGAAGNAHPAAAFINEPDIPNIPAISVTPEKEQIKRDSLAAERLAGIRWDGVKDENGNIKTYGNTIRNVCNFFIKPSYGFYTNPLNKLVRKNMFTDRIEFTQSAPWHSMHNPRLQWVEDDTRQLSHWFSGLYGWNPSVAKIYDGMRVYADMMAYHPVKEYLQSLAWDGVPRVDQLLAYYMGASGSAYVKEVSRCLLLAMVARIMEPVVCKHDYVVILEGPEGIRKSTFCELLGGEWYADVYLDPRSKDTQLYIQGKWVVELSEMAHARKADNESVKSFITKKKDVTRKPYDRDVIDLSRTCVFIGTINRDGAGTYLFDGSGNRRFLPVPVTGLKKEDLIRDRDQIFAEAFERWKKGEPHYMTDETLISIARNEQRQRCEIDLWANVFCDWIVSELEAGRCHKKLSTTFIAKEVFFISISQLNHTHYRRIGAALQAAEWRPDRVRVEDTYCRGYKNMRYDEQLQFLTKGI